MNWISVKDRLPEDSKEAVLAVVNHKIKMGFFRAINIYYLSLEGNKRDSTKRILFEPCLWTEKSSCDECEVKKSCGNQCVSCCEKDYEISLMIPSYELDEVTYWMPLPEEPKENE